MAQRWQDSRPGLDSDPRRRFFCELCQKGYARQTELDNHENDYDHQHRKREKDRKELSRDANAEAKAKAAERRAEGIKAISVASKLNETKKAPVFKRVGETQPAAPSRELDPNDPSTAADENDSDRSVRDGWWKDRYTGDWITACSEDCVACHGQSGRFRMDDPSIRPLERDICE
ncbi:hypothetical protein AMS68_000633 [Peltaster fructicola]|uniref:C2H2-type domain-containing protein n=1 Tax=Peltaster fructicola TaxID=286661 RepID=A0A6H0XK85_9PEZI|nr:hypothetical protein AMS68_000633 [Peltaster fructicola]